MIKIVKKLLCFSATIVTLNIGSQSIHANPNHSENSEKFDSHNLGKLTGLLIPEERFLPKDLLYIQQNKDQYPILSMKELEELFAPKEHSPDDSKSETDVPVKQAQDQQVQAEKKEETVQKYVLIPTIEAKPDPVPTFIPVSKRLEIITEDIKNLTAAIQGYEKLMAATLQDIADRTKEITALETDTENLE